MQTAPERLTFWMLAGSAAKSAIQAPVLLDIEFGFWVKSLRIMAPRAPQGTALEEHGGADPRAVVQSKFFDIENDPFHGIILRIPDAP